jgi:hypothetical protein
MASAILDARAAWEHFGCEIDSGGGSFLIFLIPKEG